MPVANSGNTFYWFVFISLLEENTVKSFSKIVRTGAIATALFAATSVLAFDSLKFMIPANPGGGWDQTGRNLAASMQKAGAVKSIQFDNKGGAGGTIGLAQFVNTSKGDGNAVMVGGMVMVGGIILNKSAVNLGMVTPLARLTGEYEVLVVPTNSPIKTLKDLMDKAKADPGISLMGRRKCWWYRSYPGRHAAGGGRR